MIPLDLIRVAALLLALALAGCGGDAGQPGGLGIATTQPVAPPGEGTTTSLAGTTPREAMGSTAS